MELINEQLVNLEIFVFFVKKLISLKLLMLRIHYFLLDEM